VSVISLYSDVLVDTRPLGGGGGGSECTEHRLFADGLLDDGLGLAAIVPYLGVVVCGRLASRVFERGQPRGGHCASKPRHLTVDAAHGHSRENIPIGSCDT
jgi:hypothetical protein